MPKLESNKCRLIVSYSLALLVIVGCKAVTRSHRSNPSSFGGPVVSVKQLFNRSCEKVSYNRTACDSTTKCHRYFRSMNMSLPRACGVYDDIITKNKLDKFFTALELPFEGDRDCTEIEKWIVCSVLYPVCNTTSMRAKFPCSDICVRGEKKTCRHSALSRFHQLQINMFNRRIIPECHNLPSNNENCDFPQFIADILQKHEMDSKPASAQDDVMKIVLIVSIVTCLIVGTVALLGLRGYHLRQRRRNTKYSNKMSLQEIHTIHRNVAVPKKFPNDAAGLIDSKAYNDIESLIYTKGIRSIQRGNLVFLEYLGEGEFGKVVKCKTQFRGYEHNPTLVAVKYLKEGASQMLEKNFVDEVRVLSHLKHANLLPLLGVCVDSDGPKCIVLEFMRYGDLNQYIRDRSGSYYALAGCEGYGRLPSDIEYQSPTISFHKLLYMTEQIADGISYLASKKFVHRDIATRNILVGEDFHVKVADFGMARDIYGSDYYRVDSNRMLPLRWLSPEALSVGKFTVHSDVWAFGVLMWELFTYGMQPYGGCTNEQICGYIRSHKLLAKPYGCPRQVYELIKSCWKFEPLQRKSCLMVKEMVRNWLDDEERFITIAWKQLMNYQPSRKRFTIGIKRKSRGLSEQEVTL